MLRFSKIIPSLFDTSNGNEEERGKRCEKEKGRKEAEFK